MTYKAASRSRSRPDDHVESRLPGGGDAVGFVVSFVVVGHLFLQWAEGKKRGVARWTTPLEFQFQGAATDRAAAARARSPRGSIFLAVFDHDGCNDSRRHFGLPLHP